MGADSIVVLAIDDNPAAIDLLRRLLDEAEGVSIHLESASSLEMGLERLKSGGIDVVLLDILLPDSWGFDAFSSVHRAVPQVPVIIMSGIDDEMVALKMVREGAQDYLIKGEVDSRQLVRAIRCAIERARGGEARDVQPE